MLDQLLAQFSLINGDVAISQSPAECRAAWLAGLRAGRVLDRILAHDPTYGPCPHCVGTGVDPERAPVDCSLCSGVGVMAAERRVDVSIPELDPMWFGDSA